MINEEIQSQMKYWNTEAESFERIYSHEKSSFSNFLDRTFRKDMYERFTFTIEHALPIEQRTFLDVGCGNGLYCLEFAKRGASKVVGLDISLMMLQLCRQSARQAKVENRCTFIQSDLLQYNPESTFDVAIGIGLFDYIRDPFPVLQRMQQVTTDRIIISFPRIWTWRAPIRKIRLSLRRCNVYFYTKDRIAQLMRDAGFARHSIHNVGKLYCVIGFIGNPKSFN